MKWCSADAESSSVIAAIRPSFNPLKAAVSFARTMIRYIGYRLRVRQAPYLAYSPKTADGVKPVGYEGRREVYFTHRERGGRVAQPDSAEECDHRVRSNRLLGGVPDGASGRNGQLCSDEALGRI